ncbi:ABC transporter substrate-binding protein [Thermoanaerobacterium thermosaccharolyticum]|uniref:ABC transporter substrate-binding protein n=1 Tax=Thermoanaerobacterium thermosaccharolyticum TaxID=1517 RepID=UPI001780A1A1|nr:ABC transporter substrate-binding protein [Thermoanaerobacterium thermosaccharolyticum]MBE0067820.1 ABC transporter substrate-binding protein [Thermoanaerobacterium thermosaccharolyticum]MBE0227383.1 ABC transporter substrate-binding protein [Thermoanaerobacterium thermosaccharolyticum]
MRRFIFVLAAFFIFSVVLSGCGSRTISSGSTEKMITIGITQIVEHPALDSAREGFIKALKDNGYVEGKNVTFIQENAQGDMSTAQTIAKKFVDKNVDLIFSIATPTTQAVKKATSTIPIVFTAVTDPVAAGLVKSFDKPGGNVTGTSDMEPINDQLKLIKDLVPGAKRIGIIYNAGEVNSTVQVKIAKDDAVSLGYSIVEATVSNSSEVNQAAQSLVGKVDAIWLPTDNTVASSVAAIIKVANSAKIPVVVAEKGMVEGGSLATLGISYSDLGYQAGSMAIKILKGEKPANIKVETAKNLQLIINQKEADAIGLKIPDSIMKKAQEVIK